MKIACIQLSSSENYEKNVNDIIKFIIQAVKKKADLIITPETSSIITSDKKILFKYSFKMENDPLLNKIKIISKKYKKWILIGSLIIKINKKKLVNRSILINPKGIIVSYYDKIHMYDAKLSKNEFYKESKIFASGKKNKVTKLPWGKLGLSICYDLRFPNMFRQMSKKGALFLSIPSAFTETTGKKHWHALLKARAIENFCYIFAPAQSGTHYNGRKTYGHSLIISPDGKILKELKKKEGVITAKIIPKLSLKLRNIIPSLKLN